ncbi:MAG: DUF58 domain-containing protein [Verrucomicrobiales bacterium]|nr:DUF58 domain-containing protein [Verrucomicrobiales bacterium]|tara:strand:+ start:4331 stop:5194 length:864 start_codon:yes stop_codon:yes gene_type:complete
MTEHILDCCDPIDSRQFIIAIKKLADDIGYGSDRSTFLGSGIEYIQSRAYQIGDPIKSIDWKVTGRTGKFHVKEYEAPKQIPIYLLIDTSASMTVSSIKTSKYHSAVRIAGGIALAALERISPVGVVGAGGRELFVNPTLSKDRILQWLLKLRSYRVDEPTRIGSRLSELMPILKSRSMIVLISDLYDSSAMPALKLAAQKHDCVVLKITDPVETEIHGAGFVKIREAETGSTGIIKKKSKITDSKLIAEELKKSGIDFLQLFTNEPIAHKLRQFFKSRTLLSRATR